MSAEVDELVAKAARAAVKKRAATEEARGYQVERSRAIWQLRQETGWSSMKIARKLSAHLFAAGVRVDSGHGISHDNVRRVVEGPDPGR